MDSAQDSDLEPDLRQTETLSEIKPPLKITMNKTCDVLQIHDSDNPNISQNLTSHSDEEQYLMWWSKENGWAMDFQFPKNFTPNILITESCWKWKKATPDCYPISKPNFQEKKNINCQTEPNKAKWTFLIEDSNDGARCFENDKSSSVLKEGDFKNNLLSTNQTYIIFEANASAPCVFPFKYKEKFSNTCIKDGSSRPKW